MIRRLLFAVLGITISVSTLLAQEKEEVTYLLDSVKVVAHNSLIKKTADGYEIRVPGNFITRGKQTTDILKVIPGIKYSHSSLDIIGKTATKVYIDDRQVQLDGNDLHSYLQSIPADNLKSVMIITSPSAEYDAEGDVGIIRIMTKASSLSGIKGNVNIGWGQNHYASFMGTGYIAYYGDKFFFDGSLSSDAISYLNETSYKSIYPSYVVNTYNPKTWVTYETVILCNLGYNFNEKSTLTANVRIPIYNKGTISDLDNYATYQSNTDSPIDSVLVSTGVTNDSKYNYNVGLHYKLNMRDSLSLSISADYLNNQSSIERSSISELYKKELSQYKEHLSSMGTLKYGISTIRADFSFPLWNFQTNIGTKFSSIRNISDDSYVSKTKTENLFDYKETIEALYFNAEREWEKWAFQLGLRAEFTQTSSVSNNDQASIFKKHYAGFFPSLSVLHDFGQKSSVSISYSRRICRPPYKYLDPFKWYITKYSYSVGNPELKPSYIDNLELNYNYGDSFQARLFAKRQTDMIGKLVVLDEHDINIQVETANNFLTEESFGAILYKSFNPIEWYSLTAQCECAYNKYKSCVGTFPSQSGWMSSFSFYNSLCIGDNIDIDVNIVESLPGLYNYRRRENSFQFDVGITYSFFHDKCSIGLEVIDLFKTAEAQYTYVSGGVTQIYNNYYDSRSLLLSFKWNFGNAKLKISHSLSSNSEEKSRIN